MDRKNLVIFKNGTPIRLQNCGCDTGEIVEEKVTIADIYSEDELQNMDADPNEKLDEYFMCTNCEQKLEEL